MESGSVALAGFVVAAASIRRLTLRSQRWEVSMLRADLSGHYRLDLTKCPYVSLQVIKGGNQVEIDEAFVVGDGEALRIYGKKVPCSVPQHLVRAVRYNKFPASPRPQMEIDWNTGSGVRTLYLVPKGCSSRWEANRVLDSLQLAHKYGRQHLPARSYILPPFEE